MNGAVFRSLMVIRPSGWHLACAVVATVALVGCVALDSTPVNGRDPHANEARVGDYYLLPRGTIQLDGQSVAAGSPDYQVIVKTTNVGDGKWRYYLAHHTNVLYDDDLVLKANGKGLLETVSLTSQDQTPAIIDTAVQTFIDLAKIAGYGGFPGGGRSEQPEVKPRKPFHTSFDPFDTTARKQAIRDLDAAGFRLSFNQLGLGDGDAAPDSKAVARAEQYRARPDADPIPQRLPGVVYRPPTTIDFEIVAYDNSQAIFRQHYWVRVPNPHEIAVMDTSRSALVKRKSAYTFMDGDPVEVNLNKPSQALALVGIPASIVKKISSAIPDLITIQDNRAKRADPELVAQKTKLDAQTAEIQAKLNLLAAQQKLQATQPNSPNNGGRSDPSADEAQTRMSQEETKARTEKALADRAESIARRHKANEELKAAGLPTVESTETH